MKRDIPALLLGVWLSTSALAHETAIAPPPDFQGYAAALRQQIGAHWIRPSGMAPDAACPVLIRQLPGGGVVHADVLPGCTYDDAGKASVIRAVYRASPLPYAGHEREFDHEIRLVFRTDDMR